MPSTLTIVLSKEGKVDKLYIFFVKINFDKNQESLKFLCHNNPEINNFIRQ